MSQSSLSERVLFFTQQGREKRDTKQKILLSGSTMIYKTLKQSRYSMTINLKHESNAFILFQGDDGKKEELFLSRIARVFFAFLESRSRLAREKASSVSSSAFADSHFFGYGKAMMANEKMRLNPVLFSFCLFGRDAVMDNNSLSLFAKDEE